MSYLKSFSPANWRGGTNITKEAKKRHTLTDCKACKLYNFKLQDKFPQSRFNRMFKSSSPLSELNMQKSKSPKMSNKSLRDVGKDIYSVVDERCKENYGKAFSDIGLLVPDAKLQKRFSPGEKRKIKRINQRWTKKRKTND